MKTKGQNSPRRGFTLIELLVVIAIIGVLALLTTSAVSRVKKVGQRVACINKLRQWGMGVRFFADDNDDRLPQEAVFDGINTWEMTTFSICSKVWYNSTPRSLGVTPAATFSKTPSSQRAFYSRSSFFHCPAARFAPVSATYPNFSLAMNSKLLADYEANPNDTPETVTLPEMRMSQIIVPTRTALFLDAGVAGEPRASQFQPPYSGQPKAYATEFSARHGGMGNILFAAGNVSSLNARDVLDLDPNSPRRGGGVFPPSAVIWRHDPALVP
jgi:prepilin-type N-terminal cleavage/methylation domain-containing protein